MRDRLIWFATPLIIVILFGAGFAADSVPAKGSPSKAEKNGSDPKDKKTEAPSRRRFKGEITSLDTKASTFSVKSTAGEKTFVTQDAAEESIKRIAVGERVRVTYLEKDGKQIATSVVRLKAKHTNQGKSEKTAKNTSPKPATKEPGKAAATGMGQ
jgi:hypothetical protein